MKNSASYEHQYIAMINDVLLNGTIRDCRNAETQSVFGGRLVLQELRHGVFPLLHGRRLYYAGVLGELAAMLEGPKSVEDFKRHGCNYWGQWADEDGALRVDYGNAWLDFNGYNQLEATIKSLREDPYGRRHIISAWRPDKLHTLSLPCCHLLYQWYVDGDGFLNLMWYQRSADLMVGVPSDVILAAAWLINMAELTGLKPGTIDMIFCDLHIYTDHFQGVHEYLSRHKADPLIAMKQTGYKYHGQNVRKMHETDTLEEYFLASDITIPEYAPAKPISFEVFA